VFGMTIIGVIAGLPWQLVGAIVGLALLGPLMGAASGAFAVVEQRFAALVTLVVTASGMSAFGIGAAFWGLLAGLLAFGLERGAARLR
jgi:benzoate membrane transport protein